jgi:hypothetical protein
MPRSPIAELPVQCLYYTYIDSRLEVGIAFFTVTKFLPSEAIIFLGGVKTGAQQANSDGAR